MKFELLLAGLLTSMAITGAHAASCDAPSTSQETADCLGAELREADASINSAYQQLMLKLPEVEKASLRTAQRAWIKQRDATCKLDTKEGNRDRWYKVLLQDYGQTVCVTRFTRKRTAELSAMLSNALTLANETAKSSPPVPLVAPTPTPGLNPAKEIEHAFDGKRVTTHSSGKWYYEITVNYAEVVAIEPCVFNAGIAEGSHTFGVLDNVRAKDSGRNIMRYGFATDLDNGKLYLSKNGNWVGGDPGSNLGMDIKLGKTYYGVFGVSADSPAPYIQRRAIAPNFGDTPMTYALPAGYRPWRDTRIN